MVKEILRRNAEILTDIKEGLHRWEVDFVFDAVYIAGVLLERKTQISGRHLALRSQSCQSLCKKVFVHGNHLTAYYMSSTPIIRIYNTIYILAIRC